MAQRSISSFFFKGAASVGAGAPATAVAADPTSPPAVANDAETADAPTIETRKRKRESGDEGPAPRDETPGTGTPGRSDDHGVSATGDSVSPETRAEILAVTAERDPRRRDAMRERLGENAVGSSESKRREVRERFKWLDAKHVVDDKGRRPSHEDYDGNTVRVPSHLKLSASQKQYWDVKSKFRDVVLFFKVGKFYELYEDDAEIGCAALDWKMTVSGVGHCRQVGCPESGVDAAIAELVRRGHKVGRIEQMETAAEAKARTGSKTAVIRRELLETTSPATAVDGDLLPSRGGQSGVSSRGTQSGVRPAHLMAIAPSAIAERGDGNALNASATVGFAFLDAAAGTLRCGSFADDADSKPRGAQSHIALSTLLTQTSPAEVLVRRGDGGRTEARVRAALADGDPSAAPRVTSVASDADEGGPEGFFFPARARDADAALARFFLRDLSKNTDARTTQSDKSDILAFVATQPAETRCAVAALAAHLTRLRCAAPLLAAEAATHAVYAPGETARLDGPTVRHLELLCGPDGTLQGSVLGELDTCATPAGSRTLRRWLAAPLTSPARVAERQDAVAFFGGFAERTDERDNNENVVREVGNCDNCGRLRRALRRVPDLERCVGRARAASAAKTADPRALPEPLAEKRHKRRVAALAAAVAAADAVVGALRDVADIADFQARAPALVKAAVRAAHPETLGGGASDALEEARAALDWGSHPAGDDAGFGHAKTASRTAAAAAPALKSTRARLEHASTSMEASPEADLSMDVLAACEREVDALLERFLEHAPCWCALATAAARLDALAALAAFGANAAGPTCRPAFVRRAEDAAPTFHARALWNPCAVESLSRTGSGAGSGVVPNDLDLGGERFDASGSGTPLPPAVLLTGPNMGGKSTLLRAACVAVVLAQVGAPVPCASLTLSPADVVFTRLGGASDRLDAGESTFLVECAEAASILRGASRDSFVVLDELGRGTSTFDGYAVAHAALHALSVRTKCRLLFATHYHALSRAFGATPAVALRHMAARVGAEHLGDRSIAFLYALRPGACPKSYGTNVAALAGVPESVLVRATQASAAMERKLAGAFAIGSEDSGERDARALRRALAARDPEALGEAWASLR